MANPETTANAAQRRQEGLLTRMGALGLAFAGGKFKASNFHAQVKRFQKNFRRTNSAVLINSGTFQDATLTFKLEQGRWASIGALLLQTLSDALVPLALAKQMYENLQVEIIRASQDNAHSSFGAYHAGWGQADINGAAVPGARMNLRDIMLDGSTDLENPLDFLNEEQEIKLKITGLAGTAAAGGYTGNMSVVGDLYTLEAIAG
jgi:hypothetical protein